MALKSLWEVMKKGQIWLRLAPFIALAAILAVVLYGGIYAWTYTNSAEFCGSTCHTMPPEYSAYQRSPHARVQCVECHLGRDIVTKQFTRKAGDLRHVLATLTRDYEFPIFAKEMRPARETCEKCHYPEKFSDDSLREIQRYLPNEENDHESIFLILKTGGGSKREGLGKGIHWHIENPILFLATDELQQNIPYVRVVHEDGTFTEYYDVTSGFTPYDVERKPLQRMDCITCHNRVTHRILAPDDAVDQALSKGLLPKLPDIRRQAENWLRQPFTSVDEAQATLAEQVPAFYQQHYPDVSAEDVQQAVSVLQEMYARLYFPEQKTDWQTHPDNLGHRTSPGCFRCHDGKHMTATGEAIRLECNLCHSVPVISQEGERVARIEIVRGPEPVSHTHSSWISLHGQVLDSSCQECHPPASPDVDYIQLEGKLPSDGSFCGNPMCHDRNWQYAAFDEPALQPLLDQQLYILLNTSPYLLEGVPRTYEGTFKAIFDGRCVFCHSEPDAKADLDMSTYEGILRGGKNGPGIAPGDLKASLIWQRQTRRKAHFGQMLDDELEALRDWILAGAPER